jgi:hypothetical protein
MVKHDNGTIRSVAWSELFPWLRLIRTFRLAVSLRGLVFGAAAFLLTVIGWGVIWADFSQNSNSWFRTCNECPWKLVDDAMLGEPSPFPLFSSQKQTATTWQANNPVVDSWTFLLRPTWEGLSTLHAHKEKIQYKGGIYEKEIGLGKRDIVCLILCGLWGTAVWALFGAAICRTAAVRLAAEEQISGMASLRYAVEKWPAYFTAPLLPLLGVLVAAVIIMILGVIMKVGAGLALGGLFWFLALALGFVMALLLLGLLFGWPLMWGAISAEGTDSFDALSRSYAYVFQRPLHYLFYVAFTAVIGMLGWILVKYFAGGVIWLSYWAVGWGCGTTQFSAILPPSNLTGISGFGAKMIEFWTDCVKLLAVGYFFSYFWTASTAIYFQLRRDVDATDTDEVFLDADADEEPAGLPSITTDAAGAPVAEPGPAEDLETAHE